MVLNQIRTNIRLFHSICSNTSLFTMFVYRSIESALRETSINTNRTVCRGEMMKKDTVIKLIKLTLKNFEETNDVEHLNDIIQIIFEYKKSQQRHLLTNQ